ncbi:DNA damage-regulated autophagy modulator protein 1-like isoform X2 [Vespa velutina]|uniref:DNA damage-regulated autophagy modulator protein 1-like isoform X2 n=1 Tax=Vespa velutina TaxID=202808 RepID=UPI001FB5007E|nr:DNA damage-regulated autophagy modulator protein 1-like isoform X2 [Vespa velutina]
MEVSNLSPTLKHRRKFERIKTINTNYHDTSFVNHNSDLYTISKLYGCINQKAQTLTDCCKESTDKCLLQEEKDFIDPIDVSRLFLCLYMDHAELRFMYISETAYYFPETSFFAQFMNLIVLFGSIAVFLRHFVLLQFIRDRGENVITKKFSNISTLFGSMMLMGINILGNYPIVQPCYVIHCVGVLLFFLGVTGYSITQTKITKRMIGIVSDYYIYYIRIIATIILFILLILILLPGIIIYLPFNDTNYTKWTEQGNNWFLHNVSVVAEWLYVIFCSLYIVTFVYEYEVICFEMFKIKITYLDKRTKKELRSEI